MKRNPTEKPVRTIGKSLKNINDRIEFVRKTLDFPISAFSKKLGVSKSALINVLSAEVNRDPSFKMIQSICRVFPVSNEWLLLGHGEPFTADDISEYEYKESSTEPTVDPDVNKRLKEIRLDASLSQAMFADDVKSSRNVIAFIENNRQAITIPLMKRVVEKFNINPVWLLFGTGNKYLLARPTKSVATKKGK